MDNIGATVAISNRAGDGFTVIHDVLGTNYADESTLETYDAAGNRLASVSAGKFTGDCGAADVVNSAGRLVITLLVRTTPAQGIKPASYGLTMTAWNAVSGGPAWTATLVQNTTQRFYCPPSMDGVAADLWNFIPTLDGRWGVAELPTTNANGDLSYDAIDLTTGRLYSNPDLEGVLGDDVVTGSGNTGNNSPTTLTVTTPGSWAPLGTAAGSGASGVAGLQLSGDIRTDSEFTPQDYGETGYTGSYGTPGSGIGAVATPDGGFLIATYSDSNGNSWYGGYSLPSLHRVWSAPVPRGADDQIAGVTDTALLITRARQFGDTYLMSLDPKTGQQQWKIDIGSGSVCDLTSTQVLVSANSQLATLSAATGKQLSFRQDPYQDVSGGASCPAVIETGLGGTGFDHDQVTQLLTP